MSHRPLAIGLVMDRPDAAKLAREYRLALDWSHEEGFIAQCVEIDEVSAAATTAEAAVELLQERLEQQVAKLSSSRHPAPPPLNQIEGPLGSWMNDLDILPDEPGTSHHAEMDESEVLELRRIARCAAARYRTILSKSEQGFVAWCPEVPDQLASGNTVTLAIEALRPKLAQCALRMLAYGLMPPEPLQDAERRTRHRAESQQPMAKAA